jgi:hypothetical protein
MYAKPYRGAVAVSFQIANRGPNLGPQRWPFRFTERRTNNISERLAFRDALDFPLVVALGLA